MKNDSANSTASVLQSEPPKQKTRNASVSIKDVARQAKVAPSTVSAALSGNGRISDALREKVTKIAAEMNYRPRMAAQLLRANNTGYIGLLFTKSADEELTNPNQASFDFAGWYTTHFLNVCQAEGLRSQIEFVVQDQRTGTGHSQLVHGGMIDGAIIVGMTDRDCPLAQQMQQQPDFPWVTFDEPSDHCVLSATDQGVEQAMQHLAALGHRRIAMTRGELTSEIHAETQRGFDRAVEQYDIQVRPNWTAEFKSAEEPYRQRQIQWVRQLLGQADRPSAIICGGAVTAGIVLHTATEFGLQVPRDLSVIALGYSQLSSVLHPRPVMIEPDFSGMMRGALDMVRSRLANRPIHEPVQRFMPQITAGQTVAKAAN